MEIHPSFGYSASPLPLGFPPAFPVALGPSAGLGSACPTISKLSIFCLLRLLVVCSHMGPGGIERYSTQHSVCDLRQFFVECVKN